MGLDFRGKREIKACATRTVVFSPQATAMRFKDGTADAKSHAGAMELGGKEGIKDLVRLLWRKSHAGIADRHQNLRSAVPLRYRGAARSETRGSNRKSDAEGHRGTRC